MLSICSSIQSQLLRGEHSIYAGLTFANAFFSSCSVKSDALFSYQPPFNLLAFILLKPASYILTPRALHSANVFLIRLTVGLAFFSSNILYLPYVTKVWLQGVPLSNFKLWPFASCNSTFESCQTSINGRKAKRKILSDGKLF